MYPIKIILKVGLIFLSTLIFIHCQKDTVIPQTMEVTPLVELIDTIYPTGDEQYISLDSDYLFDQNKLPTFELEIPEANLAELDGDPAAEKYVAASLTFEGETLSPIGVRYKGSIGAFAGCLSGPSLFEPSGFKTCSKLSMKVKINWEGREDHFFGLKKLQFHSMNQDPSQMRDRLGYWLFAQMGIPTPRAVHARLMINGEFAGLFILVEQIDGRFSRYHLDDGKGNVYKEVWPLNEQGNPQTEFDYRAALQTNEDENPSFDIIRNLAQEIEQATNEEELKMAVSKWMDLDKTIGYAMVDRMIKHDDGPFHWYCFDGCSPHNFYLVEEPNNKKIHLIPWDLDNSFEGISNPNPITYIPDEWGETRNNCNPFTTGVFGLSQRSAACDNLVYAMSLYEEEFENLKQAFIQGPFSAEVIDALLTSWSSQIRASTTEASNQFSDAISVAKWEEAMTTLKAQCEQARNQ